MFVYPEHLKAHLRQQLAPLYLVIGAEPLLILEAQQLIRESAQAAGYTWRQVYTIEAGFDYSVLYSVAGSASLFAEKSLQEINFLTPKPGNAGTAVLQWIADHPPKDQLWIITFPKLDRNIQNSAWFKSLSNAAVHIPITPVHRDALPGWLKQRLALQQQSTTEEALHYLAERLEGNLTAAQQELQKLALLCPPGEISLQAIEEAVSDVACFDLSQLSIALLKKERLRACRILSVLKRDGESPALILWALVEDAYLLHQVAVALAQGTPEAQLIQQYRIWGGKQKYFCAAALKLDRGYVSRALAHAAKADRVCKGIEEGDIWLLLEQLSLLLTGANVLHDAMD